VSDISRRTLLGATGTVAAATLITTTGTAQAAETAGGKRENTSQATTKGTNALMAATTTTLKYEAYLVYDAEGDIITSATFEAHADPGDMWAFIDAATARYQQTHPTMATTGHVDRYDQVVTEIPHP
jgi:secreted PhoX family phosphatase